MDTGKISDLLKIQTAKKCQIPDYKPNSMPSPFTLLTPIHTFSLEDNVSEGIWLQKMKLKNYIELSVIPTSIEFINI